MIVILPLAVVVASQRGRANLCRIRRPGGAGFTSLTRPDLIDSQLQEAIFDFERTSGVVATIKGDEGSKSSELAAALSGAKKIVVCTIQTFPYALKAVRELAATQGKRFAVIADEAHSSQTGDAAAKLKAVLSPEELAELADGGEVSTEDILAAQMAARADDGGITFVAFAVIHEYLDALDSGRFNYRPGFGCSMCDFRQQHCSKWAG